MSGQLDCNETWCVRQQSRVEWIGLERDMHGSHAVKSSVLLQWWRVEGVIVTEGVVCRCYGWWSVILSRRMECVIVTGSGLSHCNPKSGVCHCHGG